MKNLRMFRSIPVLRRGRALNTLLGWPFPDRQ
jgi:hypothetical protein